MEKSLFWGMVAVFAYHVYGMALRWYISGYAPWSNSYETMVYVSWATVLAGLILGRKNSIILSLAVLFAGMILFVSGLQWMDPQITPLVPVLKSPWLMFHVAVIASAYGFFGFGFLLGTATISWMAFGKKEASVERRIRELTLMNQLSLLTGLALMTIGIFLGAVWANESWGRYWGWDPKETWALIVMVAYAVVTHLHLVKRWNNAWLFNLCSVFAFTTVLMTFLGVNYLLSGMHSYGHTEGAPRIFGYILLFYGLVSVLGVVSFRKRRASF
jgi:cytochrome c-type biogenesis protein CcsB